YDREPAMAQCHTAMNHGTLSIRAAVSQGRIHRLDTNIEPLWLVVCNYPSYSAHVPSTSQNPLSSPRSFSPLNEVASRSVAVLSCPMCLAPNHSFDHLTLESFTTVVPFWHESTISQHRSPPFRFQRPFLSFFSGLLPPIAPSPTVVGLSLSISYIFIKSI